jgi:hypothetical protein
MLTGPSEVLVAAFSRAFIQTDTENIRFKQNAGSFIEL